nr:xylulose kinase-1 [Tanacetum cinerariifolium]
MVQETTDKVVLIKERLKAARDPQKSYADNSVQDTFHVSNLKKCLADANLHVALEEIKEAIMNGNARAAIASVSSGAEATVPPKTTAEKIARMNKLKVKSTLLLAILDENLLKFHGIKDAKTLWEAIKTRFRGNKESMKMQKTILKQQYENFVAS